MNPKSTKMFSTLHTTYKNIVSCLGVIGYLEEDIIKRGINTNKNLQLTCLYAYPNKKDPFLRKIKKGSKIWVYAASEGFVFIQTKKILS